MSTSGIVFILLRYLTPEDSVHQGIKNVEPVLSLVPRFEGLRIAQLAETSNAESPTYVYILNSNINIIIYNANEGYI